MTGALYPPARARQLRMLVWITVAAAVVLLVVAVVLLLGGSPVGPVLLVLVVPAGAIAALGAWTVTLLGRGDPRARIVATTTGVLAMLAGLLLSRTGGLVIGVLGILVLLFALLPGRDPDVVPEMPDEH